MPWGVPHGPTTGEMERIDVALTEAGIPTSDDGGYPIGLCVRVNLAMRRLRETGQIIEKHHQDFVRIDDLLHDRSIAAPEALQRIRGIVRCVEASHDDRDQSGGLS